MNSAAVKGSISIRLGLLLLLLPGNAALASYGIYVGKNLTVDGSVLLGGTGDEVSSHWLEIVPRKTHPEGATISVGVDDRATYPGKFIEIPQVRDTAKYITMNYSDYEGDVISSRRGAHVDCVMP